MVRVLLLVVLVAVSVKCRPLHLQSSEFQPGRERTPRIFHDGQTVLADAAKYQPRYRLADDEDVLVDKISFQRLQDILDNDHVQVMLIDIRPRPLVERDGWIPYSNNIPVQEIRELFGLDDEQFEEVFGFDKYVLQNPQEVVDIVLYGYNSNPAMSAARALLRLGYPHVRVYDEGFVNWLVNDGQIEKSDHTLQYVVEFPELKSMVEQGNILVVDVRPMTVVRDQGMIPGSINIPYKYLSNAFSIPYKEFETIFGYSKPELDAENFIVYGQAGPVAQHAAKYLRDLGYDRFRLYERGFPNWIIHGGRVEFAEIADVPTATYDDVEKVVKGEENAILLDVRPKVARNKEGYIKGSHNVLVSKIHDTFLLPEDEFKHTLGFDKPKFEDRIIVYCQDGFLSHQATENLMNIGYQNVKCYMGSFDEWSTRSGDVEKDRIPDVLPLVFDDVYYGIEYQDLTLVDVRPPFIVYKDGKIPTSYNIPYYAVKDAFSLVAQEFFETYGFPKPAPNRDNLGIYGRAGFMNNQAAKALQDLGYTRLRVFHGGFESWYENGGEIEVPLESFIKEATFEEVKEAVALGPAQVLIIDSQPTAQRQENGWIPNSIGVTYGKISAVMNKNEEDFLISYGHPKPSKDVSIITYADGGYLSRRVAVKLNRLGFSNVRSYDAGFADWQERAEVKKSLLEISEDELRSGVNDNSLFLIDVRHPDIVFTDGKIPGSYNIPSYSIKTAFRMPDADFQLSFGVPKPPLESENLVLYGEDKAMTRVAVKIFTELGYENIRVFEEGFTEWRNHNQPVIIPEEKKLLRVNLRNVKNGIENKNMILIDVRPRKFREDFGWIPGSYSIPLTDISAAFVLRGNDFWNTYGFIKPPSSAANLVVYSMYDVQARQGVVMLRDVGYKNVRLFTGGFSTWVRNGEEVVQPGGVVSFNQLIPEVERRNAILIDVRTPNNIYTFGKIPGSHNLPYPIIKFAFDMPDADFKVTFGLTKPSLAADMIVYGEDAKMAQIGAKELQDLGYSNIRLYEAGFPDWDENGGPVEYLEDFTLLQMGFNDMKESIADNKDIIIDVRPSGLRVEEGWIPHSYSIPLPEVREAFVKMIPEDFQTKYGFLRPTFHSDNIIVYSSFGIQARIAGELLQKMGYSNVRSYGAGFTDWKDNSGPIARPVEQLDMTAVRNGLANGDLQMIDVRSQQDFLDDGAVPSSFNVPLNFTSTAFSLPKEDFEIAFGFQKPEFSVDNLVLTGADEIMADEAIRVYTDIGFLSLKEYKGGFSEWESEGGVVKQHVREDFPILDFEDVQNSLRLGNITLIDVRSAFLRKENGWIPDSTGIPLSSIVEKFSLTEEEFLHEFKFIKPSFESSTLVLYGIEDILAQKAGTLLRTLGYYKVQLYADGFRDWSSKTDNIATIPPLTPATIDDILGRPAFDAIRDEEELHQLQNQDNLFETPIISDISSDSLKDASEYHHDDILEVEEYDTPYFSFGSSSDDRPQYEDFLSADDKYDVSVERTDEDILKSPPRRPGLTGDSVLGDDYSLPHQHEYDEIIEEVEDEYEDNEPPYYEEVLQDDDAEETHHTEGFVTEDLNTSDVLTDEAFSDYNAHSDYVDSEVPEDDDSERVDYNYYFYEFDGTNNAQTRTQTTSYGEKGTSSGNSVKDPSLYNYEVLYDEYDENLPEGDQFYDNDDESVEFDSYYDEDLESSYDDDDEEYDLRYKIPHVSGISASDHYYDDSEALDDTGFVVENEPQSDTEYEDQYEDDAQKDSSSVNRPAAVPIRKPIFANYDYYLENQNDDIEENNDFLNVDAPSEYSETNEEEEEESHFYDDNDDFLIEGDEAPESEINRYEEISLDDVKNAEEEILEEDYEDSVSDEPLDDEFVEETDNVFGEEKPLQSELLISTSSQDEPSMSITNNPDDQPIQSEPLVLKTAISDETHSEPEILDTEDKVSQPDPDHHGISSEDVPE